MLHEKVQNGKKIALQSIDRNINWISHAQFEAY